MKPPSRFTYLLLLVLLFSEAAVLTIDVSLYFYRRPNAFAIELSGLSLLKDWIAGAGFTALYILIRRAFRPSPQTSSEAVWIEPTKALWFGIVCLGGVLVTLLLYDRMFPNAGFREINGLSGETLYLEQSLQTVFKSHLVAVTVGAFLLAALFVLERLIFFRRLRNTRANFLAMVVLLVCASLSMAGATVSSHDVSGFAAFFTGFAVLMMLVNSLRLSWILSLARRDKLRLLWLIPLLLIAFALLFAIDSGSAANISDELYAHSGMVGHFLISIAVFAALYLLFAFVSVLLYLPTSEAFEKKASEMRNLYAMSRFVTDVFDEEKIYDSLLVYASDASGASMSWLDLYAETDGDLSYPAPSLNETIDKHFATVSRRNIDADGIKTFIAQAPFIRRTLIDKKIAVQIDDILTDRRLGKEPSVMTLVRRRLNSLRGGTLDGQISSFVAVPLLSRTKLIGVLNMAKDIEYGFVRDELELISTFADQAAIAIDNSRLIKESIDKERLQQELMIAQKIQLQLLPQSIPHVKGFEIDGLSYPAYEVGGDYYDFVALQQEGDRITRFGIVIADVSGKGTSAAFYMAELKGIFQSLSRIYPASPKELLIRANETLMRNLAKKSFVSVLYGVVDAATSTLLLSNAGHCPAVHIRAPSATEPTGGDSLVRMKGLALGLDGGKIFNKHIEEETLSLSTGDVVVFYTDGVIEAIDGKGEQFGMERLAAVVAASRHKTACDIKIDLFTAVNAFTEPGGAVTDDLTIVVIKAVSGAAALPTDSSCGE